jgi:hypothetical protein
VGGWEEGVQEVKGVGGCVQEAGGRGAGGEGGGRGGGGVTKNGVYSTWSTFNGPC